MVQSEFSAALNQVCSEKGLSPEAVLATIEQALISAYRKDYGGKLEELTAKVSALTGEARVFKDGQDVTPPGFGRIASQTAKQVLIQRLREAEKGAIAEDYAKKIGALVYGHIFRMDRNNAYVDLGRAQGLLPAVEQVMGALPRLNQRLRFLVKEIKETEKGPEIILSRSDPKLIEALFGLEVPEITSGVVSVKAIAREPGSRTKMAVASRDPKIDPVGSCVGQKGTRVQSVLSEIRDEKIDILPYDEDLEKYIANSLSPAKALRVELNKKKHEAKVTVDESQVSLAIGKEGQNVRLAAKLTGWKIDIRALAEKKEAPEEDSDSTPDTINYSDERAPRPAEAEPKKDEPAVLVPDPSPAPST